MSGKSVSVLGIFLLNVDHSQGMFSLSVSHPQREEFMQPPYFEYLAMAFRCTDSLWTPTPVPLWIWTCVLLLSFQRG